MNYAASEGPAKEVAEAIKASGGDAMVFRANCAKQDEVRAEHDTAWPRAVVPMACLRCLTGGPLCPTSAHCICCRSRPC